MACHRTLQFKVEGTFLIFITRHIYIWRILITQQLSYIA